MFFQHPLFFYPIDFSALLNGGAGHGSQNLSRLSVVDANGLKIGVASLWFKNRYSIRQILERSEKNYGIEFDTAAWKIERAKVEAGEKILGPTRREVILSTERCCKGYGCVRGHPCRAC